MITVYFSYMVIIFIRSALTFIILLFVMRLMGKRQIGEMQPFELVITLLIAELACIPMSDISVPLIYGVSAILAVFIIHQILSLLDRSGRFLKRTISGKPSIVLNKNGVDFEELRKNNMDVEDLIESMRSAGYYSLDDLDYAIFESNGKLSAKEKAKKDEESSSLPVLLVCEGKAIHNNLALIGWDLKTLREAIKSYGAKDIREVGVLTVDGNGKMYFQKEKEKYKTFNIKIKEGLSW